MGTYLLLEGYPSKQDGNAFWSLQRAILCTIHGVKVSHTSIAPVLACVVQP